MKHLREQEMLRYGMKIEALEAKVQTLEDEFEKVMLAVISQNVELAKSLEDAMLRIEVLENELGQVQAMFFEPEAQA